MQSMKTARATISLPGEIAGAAQAYCRDNFLKFSGYVEKLIVADLEAAGKLNPDAGAAALDLARELIAARGADVVQAKLNELALVAAEAEGAGK